MTEQTDQTELAEAIAAIPSLGAASVQTVDLGTVKALDTFTEWADHLHGDIVLMPFKDGAPDWDISRLDLDWPDVHMAKEDLPRLAILIDSFHNFSADVPFGSMVSVVSWWDADGQEHVHAIEGSPSYGPICEGIVERAINSPWPILPMKRLPGDLPVVNMSAWEGRPVPPREWFIEGMMPSRNVTLLSGDGGLGKSLLALQIGIASTLERSTLGLTPKPGRVLYIGAEDEEDEFHRRADDILRHFGATFADTRGRFQLMSLAEQDATLALPGKTGSMEPTALWGHVCSLVASHRPDLVVFDTSADLYGGDEIKRHQVRQFVAMLRKMSIEYDCASLLLSHPSVAGMQTGTGMSGSTAWNNSVRSRLYLDRPNGDDADPDMRRLSTKKQNYGTVDGVLTFRWEQGAFVEVDATKPNPVGNLMAKKADELFVRLLSMLTRRGQSCSPSPSVTYGPKIMATLPEAEGMTKKSLEQAMHRLLGSGEVKIVEDGPPSKRRSRLLVSAEDFAAQGGVE